MHGIFFQKFARDIDAEAYVVYMNSKSCSDYGIKDNLNAYIFSLTSDNINRISAGQHFQNDMFMDYQYFIEWL